MIRRNAIDPQPDEQSEQGELTWRLHLASEATRKLPGDRPRIPHCSITSPHDSSNSTGRPRR